jgi:hypothetical protein
MKDVAHLSQQMFDVGDTGVSWEMSNRTNTTKNETALPSHKFTDYRLTSLLSSNASKDFKLKLMPVYQSDNLRSSTESHQK